jgi:hypothetical protein
MRFVGLAIGSALLYALWTLWVPLLPANVALGLELRHDHLSVEFERSGRRSNA